MNSDFYRLESIKAHIDNELDDKTRGVLNKALLAIYFADSSDHLRTLVDIVFDLTGMRDSNTYLDDYAIKGLVYYLNPELKG